MPIVRSKQVVLIAVLLALAGLWVFSGVAGAAREVPPNKQAPPNRVPFQVDQAGRVLPETVPDAIGFAGPDGRISGHFTREEFLARMGPPEGPPGSPATVETREMGPKPSEVINKHEGASAQR
jgi:hypothetical protein